jgi:hypothetical protein
LIRTPKVLNKCDLGGRPVGHESGPVRGVLHRVVEQQRLAVLGVEVDDSFVLIDEVAYATAGGDLVLPLRVLDTSERRRGQAAAQPVLSIRIAKESGSLRSAS